MALSTPQISQPRILGEMIESLKQASGGCSQLVHAHRNPQWMVLREAIDLSTEGCQMLATFQTRMIRPVAP